MKSLYARYSHFNIRVNTISNFIFPVIAVALKNSPSCTICTICVRFFRVCLDDKKYEISYITNTFILILC